ncbi:hypothetical protein PR048_018234 [Dryococelus australis]|uniref:Transposable element P transposase-like GTP-binding insertion domain-containing protein n=1 Tax=Dryococelus australis TaxID=614101 RepID=A0ABQ9HBS8_9NEOP|nr:hypothetical protein PR048_018234 [Dryococelus australis]
MLLHEELRQLKVKNSGIITSRVSKILSKYFTTGQVRIILDGPKRIQWLSSFQKRTVKIPTSCCNNFEKIGIKPSVPSRTSETCSATNEKYMARGMLSKWKLPVFYDFDSPMTTAMLMSIISELEASGFSVYSVTSAMGGVHVFADVPHLKKLSRNQFLDKYLILRSGETVDKSTVQQLLDKSVSKALLYNGENSLISGNWKSTAEFLELLNYWFDIFNSSSPYNKEKGKRAHGVEEDWQNNILNVVDNVVLVTRTIVQRHWISCTALDHISWGNIRAPCLRGTITGKSPEETDTETCQTAHMLQRIVKGEETDVYYEEVPLDWTDKHLYSGNDKTFDKITLDGLTYVDVYNHGNPTKTSVVRGITWIEFISCGQLMLPSPDFMNALIAAEKVCLDFHGDLFSRQTQMIKNVREEIL